jgi:hypothetical protein
MLLADVVAKTAETPQQLIVGVMHMRRESVESVSGSVEFVEFDMRHCVSLLTEFP